MTSTVNFPTTIYPVPLNYSVLTLPTNINYTSKDYPGFLSSLLSFGSQIMPDWNPTSEGDFGRILVELWCYLADILSYYGDRISQEAFLPTATQRISLLNIAQLLAYTPSNGTPAAGTVTFQTLDPGVAVTIPSLTQVQTAFNVGLDTPVIYETNSLVTCAANGGTVTVDVTQGITKTMVTLGTSDGTPGQQFTLPDTKVIDGTVSVYVQTATGNLLWSGVQYLVDYQEADEVYQVSVDALGNTLILFGDNINGEIPAIGMGIYATYRVGAGSAGNIGSGEVGTITTSIAGLVIPTESDGTTYISSQMSGGTDPETNDQIRANAPAAFRTQYRAVSLTDYSDLALAVPGVIAANAVSNHSTSVSVYILAVGGQQPSSGLISATETYFENRMLAGVSLSALAPNLIKVDVGSSGNNVTVAVKAKYAQSNVANNITSALTALLTPPSVGFAQLLNISDFYNAIMSLQGVAYCIIPVITREDVVQTGTSPLQFRANEVPVPGSFFLNVSGGV